MGNWNSIKANGIYLEHWGEGKKRRARAARRPWVADNSKKGSPPKKFVISNAAASKSGKQKRGSHEAMARRFYASAEWKRTRYEVLAERGNRCECCGATPDDSATRIVVDHIRSLRHHWELRLDKANLQVLCNDCNWGKGARDETDWRPNAEEVWDD
jgi:5-methylcytosine-specific restriction endonuclease McrA